VATDEETAAVMDEFGCDTVKDGVWFACAALVDARKGLAALRDRITAVRLYEFDAYGGSVGYDGAGSMDLMDSVGRQYADGSEYARYSDILAAIDPAP